MIAANCCWWSARHRSLTFAAVRSAFKWFIEASLAAFDKDSQIVASYITNDSVSVVFAALAEIAKSFFVARHRGRWGRSSSWASNQ